MQITIRLFAQLRDLLGSELYEEFDHDAIRVADLREQLAATRPELRPYLEHLAIAINEEYCIDPETLIREGDEVALIQPISGGAADAAELPAFLVTDAELDRNALRNLVRTDASGAIVIFEGVVRNHHEGRAVLRLEYEAYAGMAERELERVAGEVLAEFADREVHRIAAHHRTGALGIGDVSLLVAVSAAHREQAFEAALRAVDRIKETVPVWKREFGPDGTSWQEGVAPRPSASNLPASNLSGDPG